MKKNKPMNETKNPFLFNRRGHTPFDDMDSLDRLELELIREEEAEENHPQKRGEKSVNKG